MTPFQALLADAEALAEYIELCCKLQVKEWRDWNRGDYVWTVDLGHGRVTGTPILDGKQVIQWLSRQGHKSGAHREACVYIPSDIAEWMAMGGWMASWWMKCYGEEWFVGTDDAILRLDSQTAHPHLAAARAVMGGEN